MFVAVRDVSLKHANIECLKVVGELGIGAVDLLVDRTLTTERFFDAAGESYDLASGEGLARFKADISAAGISVCGVELGTDFAADDLAAEVRWMVDACALADDLGAPVVRIDPWLREGKMDTDAFLSRMAGAVRDAIGATDGIDLGVENHGRHGNQPEFMEKLLAEVDSDRFGLTLDTGNFYWAGHPLDEVYEIMARLAPAAKYTHVKNISYPAETRQQQREVGWEYLKYVAPIPDGDIDHSRVVAILSEAGYDRALVIEDESHVSRNAEEFAQVLKRGVAHLRSLVG
jgi:sugar phosphate isomerase/epimerase